MQQLQEGLLESDGLAFKPSSPAYFELSSLLEPQVSHV